ncbi:CG15927 [Drosophila busckii]|uniref:CG15927 n=1 Tax=Drosophila busckii TaxID=30019 RepID=A0A0M4EJE1_DROBS|nr:uncharacterized protein LOC108605185 [Drosophila busckii]ALC49241.1 CG15927 [Drosophila busckii]
MRLLLLFWLSLWLCCLQQASLLPPLRRNIIKVRASGFLPFESDLLLPLGILRQLQAQDRASRLMTPYDRSQRPKPKPKPKQQVRLERARLRDNAAGIEMYNLIDDDGELLLNLRVHKEQQQPLLTAPQLERTAWRPSKWRPTPPSSTLVTSSSPRPLPLHQYLSSNSLERRHWRYE